MTIMTIAGDAFNVLVEGEADKPVLMISNPLATNYRLWDPQMPALLEHYRVVRYDSRGHGNSVVSEGPYSIEGLGHDALAILDALEIDRVDWLGLSLGGIVGLWILANAPERIGRAVLANTAAQIFGPEVWNGRIETARATGMDRTAEIVAGRWFTEAFLNNHPEAVEPVLSMVRATPLQGYLAGCAALRDTDLREAIRSITRPVLVINGKYDLSTPPEFGTLVADSIEGARIVTLEAGHISNIEDERNFTRTVVSFLTAEARPRAARGKKTATKKTTPKKMALTKAAAKGKARAKAPAKAQTAPAKAAEPKRKAAQKSASKATPAKAAAKKTATKKTATKKTATKEAVTKKVAAKTATAKVATAKTAAAKTASAKVTAKKTVATKTAAKKATAQKAAMKKAVAAKAPAKKAAVKKAPVKKEMPKTATAKTSAGKTNAKKAAVKKTAVKKASVKKEAPKKRPAATAAKAPAPKAAAKKAPRKK